MNDEVRGDCIVWPGGKNRDGYGTIKVNGKTNGAHRVALERKLARKLAHEEVVMHLCHNRACINTDHLRVGTTAENNAAAAARKNSLVRRLMSGEFDPPSAE